MPKTVRLTTTTLKRAVSLQRGEVPGYPHKIGRDIKNLLKKAGNDPEEGALVLSVVRATSWATAEQEFALELAAILLGKRGAIKRALINRPKKMEMSKAWTLGVVADSVQWPGSFSETPKKVAKSKTVVKQTPRKNARKKTT